MFWSLEMDDFLGAQCNEGEFPLLTAVHDAILEMAPNNSKRTTRSAGSQDSSTVDSNSQFEMDDHTVYFIDDQSNSGATVEVLSKELFICLICLIIVQSIELH